MTISKLEKQFAAAFSEQFTAFYNQSALFIMFRTVLWHRAYLKKAEQI